MKKVKLALLTNGAGESQRVKSIDLDLPAFPICLIEGELGYGKPTGRFLKWPWKKLSVRPEQAWMVGDDLARDIAGAQDAGIFSIWHDYGKTGLPEDSKVKPIELSIPIRITHGLITGCTKFLCFSEITS